MLDVLRGSRLEVLTWRFMGAYEPIITLLITVLITL